MCRRRGLRSSSDRRAVAPEGRGEYGRGWSRSGRRVESVIASVNLVSAFAGIFETAIKGLGQRTKLYLNPIPWWKYASLIPSVAAWSV